MAYMGQEKKKQIAAELKKVMPKDWKYSLSVHHHSTLVLTISEAPVDLIEEWQTASRKHRPERDWHDGGKPEHVQVNEFYLERQFEGETLTILQAAKDAMMEGNHDRSDIQSDYFDVGWYIDINLGKWDRPFKVKGAGQCQSKMSA